ncbi:MAG: hypothetical protein RJB39_343 [Candidatus Parcubacteria bacterium]|jgi:hypothetical protein
MTDNSFRIDDFGFGGFVGDQIGWEHLSGELVTTVMSQNLLRFLHLTAGHGPVPAHVKLLANDPDATPWPPEFSWLWMRVFSETAEELTFVVDPQGMGESVVETLMEQGAHVDYYVKMLLLHTMTAVRQYRFASKPISDPAFLQEKDAGEYVHPNDMLSFWGIQLAISDASTSEEDVQRLLDLALFTHGLDQRLLIQPKLATDPYALTKLLLGNPNDPITF